MPNTTNHIIRRPDTPELRSRPMMIFSFSRSGDRRGQRLQRRWTSLPKPMTWLLRQPPLSISFSSGLPVYHHPRSVFCPQSIKKTPTTQLKSPLLRALRASSCQPALESPEAAAAAALVPRILLFPLPAAPSFSLVLLSGAAMAVGVASAVVAVPRTPPPPPTASSASLDPTVAAEVQISAVSPPVSPAAAARISPCPNP